MPALCWFTANPIFDIVVYLLRPIRNPKNRALISPKPEGLLAKNAIKVATARKEAALMNKPPSSFRITSSF